MSTYTKLENRPDDDETLFNIVSKLPYGIMIVEEHGSNRFFFNTLNPAASNILTSAWHDENINDTWGNRILPALRQRLYERTGNTNLATSTFPFSEIFEFSSAREDRFFLSINIDLYSHEPLQYIVTLNDVTQRELQRQQKQRFIEILAGSDSAFIVDASGYIKLYALGEKAKLRRGDHIHTDQYITSLFPDVGEINLAKIQHVIQTREEMSFVAETNINDVNYHLLFTIMPHLDDDGNLTAIVRTQDITEAVTDQSTILNLAKQVEQQQQEIEQIISRLQWVQRYVALIVHDLKTPLTAIKTSVQLIQEHLSNPAVDKIALAMRALRGVTQADDLTKEILAIAKSGREVIDSQEEIFDIEDTIKQIVESTNIAYTDKNIETFFKIDLIDKNVLMRKKALEHIVRNLVTNALKFSNPNGFIEIELIDINESGKLELTIRDHGIGISDDYLAMLFHDFHRGENTRGVADGHGLGLAFVKDCVDISGGNIAVESKVNEGTTFKVQLPTRNIMGIEL